ncbi:MAG: hypothetical protein QXW10_01950 [Candidatus Micrarchaeaceae archaeon]
MKEENVMDRRKYAIGGKARNCYVCGKELKAHDVKIVMPSRAVGAEGLSIEKRMLCSNCYYSMVHRVPIAPMRSSLKKVVTDRSRKLLVKEFRA